MRYLAHKKVSLRHHRDPHQKQYIRQKNGFLLLPSDLYFAADPKIFWVLIWDFWEIPISAKLFPINFIPIYIFF